MQGIQQVLDFWFSDRARERWFDPTPDFDQTVRKRFAELFARAATGSLREWETSADGCLALCILLDQLPRNMFRGNARAFGTDDKALKVAEHAVAQGFDHRLPAERRQFLFLPFMHSETLANQLRALALYEHAQLPEGRRFAERYMQIIRRFGRFPHRNALLGRPSTEDELAFLKESGESFGQELPVRMARPPHRATAAASDERESRSSGRSAS
jgi:uncharacterized protein (DUF924 family)